MEKVNDYFLNSIYNPEFEPLDFMTLGLTTDNTGLQDRDVYKNIDVIKQLPQFQTDGTFDAVKFNREYDKALINYNRLDRIETANKIASQPIYSMNNIFVAPEERVADRGFRVVSIPNPMRQNISMTYVGIMDAPVESYKEVAETNPYTYANGVVATDVNGKPITAELRSWIDNFTDPLVLAAYDDDVYETDETGKKVKTHSKGELKLNSQGQPYYEELGGRDVYGKQVLSAWDVLTEEGSTFNKIDVFDSDDIHKSWYGTLAREVVRFAPIFIPVVGEYYIASRVIMQSLDLANTLVKMGLGAAGYESEVVNTFEAANQGLAFGSSETITGNPLLGTEGDTWNLESIIAMGSQVFTQLAEQRWIFKSAPAVFYDTLTEYKGISDVMRKADKYDDYIKTNSKNIKEDLLKNLRTDKFDEKQWAKLGDDIAFEANTQAVAQFSRLSKNYQNLGRDLSLIYMTGLTALDSYGAAIAEGVDPTYAALFTLGYSLGEFAILKLGIGDHIFPELHMEKYADKRALQVLNDYTANAVTKAEKQKAAKTAFLWGLRAIQGDLANMSTLSTVGAHALGESVEEVSEELLLDLSKSLYNGLQIFAGNEDLTMKSWENIRDRYLMSALGGFIGGGIATTIPGMGALNKADRDKLKNMTVKDAYARIINAVDEGRSDDLKKLIQKTTFGSDNLSWRPENLSEQLSGEDSFLHPVAKSKTDSLNQRAKDALTSLITTTENIMGEIKSLKSTDAVLSNESVQRLAKLRLENSQVAQYMGQRYKLILKELVQTDLALKQLNGEPLSDNPTDKEVREAKKPLTEQQLADKTALENLRKDLVDELELYDKNTKRGNELYQNAALFEMNDIISRDYLAASSLQTYIQRRYPNKTLSELPKSIREQLISEYKYLRDTEKFSETSRLIQAYQNFNAVRRKTTEVLKLFKNTNLTELNPLTELESKWFGNTEGIEKALGVEAYSTEVVDDADIVDKAKIYYGQSDKTTGTRYGTTISSAKELLLNKLIDEVRKDQSVEDYKKDLILEALSSETIDSLLNLSTKESLTSNLEVVDGKLQVKENSEFAKKLKESKISLEEFNAKLAEEEFNSEIYNAVVESASEKEEIGDDIEFGRRLSQNTDGSQDIESSTINGYLNLLAYLLSHPNEITDSLLNNMLSREEIKEKFSELLERTPLSRPTLNKLKEIISPLGNAEFYIEKLTEKSKETNNTDLENLLASFVHSLVPEYSNVHDIIKNAEDLIFNSAVNTQLQELSMPKDLADALMELSLFIDLIKGQVAAARSGEVNGLELISLNKTANKISTTGEEFLELTNDLATALVRDLALYRNHIDFMANMARAISGLALKEDNRINIKVLQLLYERIKVFSDSVPDDWDKAELQKALKESVILERTLTDKSDITEELYIELRTEFVKLLDAIYTLFEKNADKNFEEVFSKFNFLDVDTAEFSAQSLLRPDARIDDPSFFWWLQSCTWAKTSGIIKDFTNTLEILSEAGNNLFAFLAGQFYSECAGYAYMLERGRYKDGQSPKINNATDLYNKIVALLISECDDDTLDTLSSKYGIVPNKKYPKSSQLAVQTRNAFFLEGGPGTGKSSGFYFFLLLTIKYNHPEVFEHRKKITIIHATKESAENLAVNLGLTPGEDCVCYDKESFFEAICDRYREIHNAETIDEDLHIKLAPSVVEDTETGRATYPEWSVKKGLTNEEVSSIVFFDESTRMTGPESTLFDQYLKEYNIIGYKTGDYHLLLATGIFGPEKSPSFAGTSRLSSILGGLRLGQVIRAESDVKYNNQKALEISRLSIISSIISGDTTRNITLQYGISESGPKLGLFGDLVIKQSGDFTEELTKEILKSIKVMLTTTKDPILFIRFSNLNTPLSKLIGELNSGTILADGVSGEGRFVPISGGASLGSESDYYIIDGAGLKPENNYFESLPVYNALYTVFTRAKKGSLAILPSTISLGINESTKVPKINTMEINEVAKIAHNNKLLHFFQQLVLKLGTIEATPKYIIEPGAASSTSETEKDDNEGEFGDYESMYKNPAELPINQILDKNGLRTILHSNAANTLGFKIYVEKSDNKLEKVTNFKGLTLTPDLALINDKLKLAILEEDVDKRVDDIYGLLNLIKAIADNNAYNNFLSTYFDKVTIDSKTLLIVRHDKKLPLILTLLQIKTLGRTGNTKDIISGDVLDNIRFLVGANLNNSGITIGFAYAQLKYGTKQKTEPGPLPILQCHKDEPLYGISTSSKLSKDVEPNTKYLTLVIYKEGECVALLPIYMLTNPITLYDSSIQAILGLRAYLGKHALDAKGNLDLGNILKTLVSKLKADPDVLAEDCLKASGLNLTTLSAEEKKEAVETAKIVLTTYKNLIVTYIDKNAKTKPISLPDDKTIGSYSKAWSMTMKTENNKRGTPPVGSGTITSGYRGDTSWKPIDIALIGSSEAGRLMSMPFICNSQRDVPQITTANGETMPLVRKGRPFILVSNDIRLADYFLLGVLIISENNPHAQLFTLYSVIQSLKTPVDKIEDLSAYNLDEDLKQAICDNGWCVSKNPITLIYTNPPSVTLATLYFLHLDTLISSWKDSDAVKYVDYSIGDFNASYRLLKIILNENSHFMKRIGIQYKGTLDAELLTRIKSLQEVIKVIEDHCAALKINPYEVLAKNLKILSNDNSTRHIVETLRDNGLIRGLVTSEISLRSIITRNLRRIVLDRSHEPKNVGNGKDSANILKLYSENLIDTDGEYNKENWNDEYKEIEERLEAVLSDMEGNFKEGIFYTLPTAPYSETNGEQESRTIEVPIYSADGSSSISIIPAGTDAFDKNRKGMTTINPQDYYTYKGNPLLIPGALTSTLAIYNTTLLLRTIFGKSSSNKKTSTKDPLKFITKSIVLLLGDDKSRMPTESGGAAKGVTTLSTMLENVKSITLGTETLDKESIIEKLASDETDDDIKVLILNLVISTYNAMPRVHKASRIIIPISSGEIVEVVCNRYIGQGRSFKVDGDILIVLNDLGEEIWKYNLSTNVVETLLKAESTKNPTLNSPEKGPKKRRSPKPKTKSLEDTSSNNELVAEEETPPTPPNNKLVADLLKCFRSSSNPEVKPLEETEKETKRDQDDNNVNSCFVNGSE